MSRLSHEECYANASALKDRVIVITGGGSGFGRALSLEFTRLGAKVVIGDVDAKGLAETVDLVTKHSVIVSAKCDVTSWDDQLALFALGFETFGAIDIVLPNAGVNEIGRFDQRLEEGAQDAPTRPNLKTVDIDLIAVLYTARIALWYFSNDTRDEPGLRGITFTGSMSTFFGVPMGVMYSVAKAGLLGILKGVADSLRTLDARAGIVCPYFTRTGIIDKDFIHPNPKFGFCKLEDVVAAFVASITDPDPAHNFGCWLVPDQWGVVRMKSTGAMIGAEAVTKPKVERPAKL